MNRALRTSAIKAAGMGLGTALLALCLLLSVRYGLTDTSWQTVYEAYAKPTDSTGHLVIRTTRVPRALLAAAVGSSLGIAGALAQALTRNPLASPGVFGINAGAAFFVVFAMVFLPASNMATLMGSAFLGATISCIIVYALGSLGRGGLSPLQVTLAGAATAALFFSMTQGLIAGNDARVGDALMWMAGSVAGREPTHLRAVFPILALGWVTAWALGRPLTTLLMGEDVARGLGQRTGLIKALTALVIVVLAGGSVALAGPISLVGLVVPHLARYLVGIDHRWVIPYAAIAGAILLVLADVGARFFIVQQEVPVGVLTALIGAPFFIYLARRGVAES
jgi:iron complex transport system permease protein